MTRWTLTSLVGTTAIALSGCADERAVEQPEAPTEPPRETRRQAYESGEYELAGVVVDVNVVELDDYVARVCEIRTPKFAFDAAKVKADAEQSFSQLAHCVTEGPLAGESLELIGHADPRGPEWHNFGLGQRRAGSVADQLMAAGVPADNMTTSSRGELEADGNGPESWAADRRVEIRLDRRRAIVRTRGGKP